MAEWVLVAVTIAYAILTYFIYRANKANVNAMKENNTLQIEIQKQNVNIELFKERIETYNELNNKFLNLCGSPYSIFKTIEKTYYKEFEYGFVYKVKFLFFDDVAKQIETINSILLDLTDIISDIKKCYERYKRTDETLKKFLYLIEKLEIEGLNKNEEKEFIEISNAKQFQSDADIKIINLYYTCQRFYEQRKLLVNEINLLYKKINIVMPTDCFKDIK